MVAAGCGVCAAGAGVFGVGFQVVTGFGGVDGVVLVISGDLAVDVAAVDA